ncbi:MAG: ATP-binding protein [Acidobacteria bacterium]|jgi:two-component system phosphate regulon sensor histidine kinase PhoR|nr:ATP-binding protein [Acidobacteriota bacterium]
MSALRHLVIVVASSLPLLIAVVLATAHAGMGAVIAGFLVWLLGVTVLSATVWRETVRPLSDLLDALGTRTGHLARWQLRLLQDEAATCREERGAMADLIEDLSAGLGDGLVVVDTDLKVRLINQVALRFCGWEEVRTGAQLVEVLRDPEALAVVHSAAAGRQPQPVVIENPRGVWEVRAFPVRRGGAVVLLTEVSSARRAAELRRRFVQDLSHELRSPLAVLRTTVEALAEEVDPASADLLVRQVERITLLSEELHELAVIEAGELQLQVEEVDVSGLVNAVIKDFRSLADRGGVRVEVLIPADLKVRSDRRALSRVLGNLIDNAIKYNREGGWVRVRASRADHAVTLEVADSGQGIPPDELSAVTQRFYRVDRGRTPGSGGLGLGLAIVKHLVQRLGGKIELDSRVDVGTTVRMVLPTLPPGDGVTE